MLGTLNHFFLIYLFQFDGFNFESLLISWRIYMFPVTGYRLIINVICSLNT